MPKSRPRSNSPSDPQSPGDGSSAQDKLLSARNGKVLNPLGPASKPLDAAHQQLLQKLAQEEAKRISEIRQDRIEQIRTALQSGKYQISSDLIADRIIQDILLNESSSQD